jgi:hypothetical protein
VLTNSVADIKIQLLLLQSTITAMFPAMLTKAGNAVADTAIVASSCNKATVTPGLSYAGIVTKDLHQVVQKTVTDVLKSEERNLATVAVHGLPDSGRDRDALHEILSDAGCNVNIVSTVRIGKLSTLSSPSSAKVTRPRLLKVVLASLAERDRFILAVSKAARSKMPNGIFASQWLSKEDFAKVKALRLRCRELNNKEVAGPSGKMPFVVISGRLMKRSTDGKLTVFRDPQPTATTLPNTLNSTSLMSETNSTANPVVPSSVPGQSSSSVTLTVPLSVSAPKQSKNV